MVLDVKRIINTPGGRIPFDFTEDFSDVDFGGVCPAVRPVSVVGQAENIAGMLRLQFDLTTTLSAVCDRCGAPFDLPYKVPFECLLAEELEEEDFETLGVKFEMSYKGAAALYYRTIQKIRKSIVVGGDKG